MPGLIILFLIFIAVPLMEIFVLIEVGSEIGALPTILLCIGTALLGAALIRRQGLATLGKVQTSLEREEVPAVAMLEGAFLLVAGICLLTPGLISDAVGFLCLVPPLRLVLIEKMFVHRIQAAQFRDAESGTRGPGNQPSMFGPGNGPDHAPRQRPDRSTGGRARPGHSQGQIIDGEFEHRQDPPSKS